MYTLNLNITICLTHSNCIYKNTLRADNNLFLNIILQLLLKMVCCHIKNSTTSNHSIFNNNIYILTFKYNDRCTHTSQ